MQDQIEELFSSLLNSKRLFLDGTSNFKLGWKESRQEACLTYEVSISDMAQEIIPEAQSQ